MVEGESRVRQLLPGSLHVAAKALSQPPPATSAAAVVWLICMKRDLALVTYSSSDESEKDSSPQPPKKRYFSTCSIIRLQIDPLNRKLPVLSSTLIGHAHVDDPSLHQGRIRSVPHVDGQYATHIYASVVLDRGSALFKLLAKILSSATNMVPTLHDFWSSPKNCEPELHISLSRPIFLRSHQREDLKRAVKHIADKNAPYFSV
jgi:hypothetical protein